MLSWLTSESIWRLIPPVTSFICFIGFIGALELVGIARHDEERHRNDPDPENRRAARFLTRRALGRAIALGLLVCSGILFAIGTWSLPIPPRTGAQIALWVNHYFVSVVGAILTVLALLDRRDRLKL